MSVLVRSTDEMLMGERKEDLMRYLKQMMQIRRFEETVYDLLTKGVIEGGSHLYAGEEAVAVGAMAAIREDDYITSTHRGHGHCLAKGGKLHLMMAEIFGKETGMCRGRGGSLHLADVSVGNLGANGVVGGSIPIATGAGLSIKMRGTDQVVLCFFGDGAVNNGVFCESLNMASIWKLPVIYICENNLYAMSVAVVRSHAVTEIYRRAAAYDMPGEPVDGQDVLAVKYAVSRAVERARRGEGPTLLECRTYRYFGHSRSDARVYRTREEEQEWRSRDPILLLSKRMMDAGIATKEEIEGLAQEVEAEIEYAVKFAMESPYPSEEDLYYGLYAD